MVGKITAGRRIFLVADVILLSLFAVICIIPFINLIAISFSSKIFTDAGGVFLWPKGANLYSYQHISEYFGFMSSLWTSVERVILGVAINFVLTVLTAYPLSKESHELRGRMFFAWFFFLTTVIQGSLIPWYLTIKLAGLTNSIWALVIPGAVPVFNVILMLNFFRGIPKELEEAALIDGAGQWKILFTIFLPMSVPSLATVTLFSFVGHWNSWFDGMILINNPPNQPLMTYLESFITTSGVPSFMRNEPVQFLLHTSGATVNSAITVVSMIPIILVFPFFQSFLKTGIVLGSVKQ